MTLFKTILAGMAAAFVSAGTGAWAADIAIRDAYARAAVPGATSGAAFMVIENTGAEGDRLTGAHADGIARIELHTHKETDGVMQMRPIEGGIEIAAGEAHVLARGGDHVMLMGVDGGLSQGGTVHLVLVFEQAGEVAIDVPVDLTR